MHSTYRLSRQVKRFFRYIRPGRAYSLLTVDDCLALGSHFYSFPHLQATLDALVNEHFAGNLLTLIPRPLAPDVLREMAKVIHNWLFKHLSSTELSGKYPPVLCRKLQLK